MFSHVAFDDTADSPCRSGVIHGLFDELGLESLVSMPGIRRSRPASPGSRSAFASA